MFRRLLALGSILSILAGLLAPGAFAAQDKFTAAPGGGPNPGYFINNIQVVSPTFMLAAQRLGGVFKSVDGGANWTPSGSGINGSAVIRSLARNGSSTTTFFVATDGDAGFYRTTDAGATWSASNSGLDCRKVRNIGFDTPDWIVSTACDSSSGFYRSSDTGVTWTRTWTSLPDDFRAWSFQRVSGSEIYVLGNYGVYRSTNNGTSFAAANGTGLNTLPTTVSSQIFAFVRRTSGRLLAYPEGDGVYYSDDSGANWFPASGLPANTFSPAAFPQISTDVYFNVDGTGLFKSTNNGGNWTPVSAPGLPGSGVRQLFVDGGNPNLWWAATFSGVYQSSGAGNNGTNYTWNKTSNGLVGGVQAATIHPTNDATFLAAGETVYKSTDGGTTWSLSDTGLGGTTGFNYSANITGHGSAPDTFYVTTTYQGVFKTTNAGGNWTAANSGITSKLKPQFVRIAPSDANTLYATALCGATGRPGGVYKSTNAGASWTDVGTSASLTNRCANSISIHPTDPNTAYLATGQALYLGTSGGSFQSSNGNTMGGLYKTTNGGASWSFVNPSKVAFPVASPDILSSDPNKLLMRSYITDKLAQATTVSGAYLSLDGGDSWTQLISNEKATQARFVQTPNGRVDAYVGTDGYFDEFGGAASGEIAFRCANILNDFSPNGGSCNRLRLAAGTRSLLRFVTEGNRLVAAATSSGIAMQSYRFLGPDFNNDGAADVWWRHSDGRNYIWNLMVSSSNDNAAVVVNPNTNGSTRTVGSPWVVAGFGDFNRDGHTDVLWRNTSSGDNYLFLMDNGAIIGEGYLPNVPPAWSVTAVGDFNGDGYADIWWNNGAQNYMYLLGVPSGTFPVVIGEGFMPAVYDANWSIAGTGDFNGDGKTDIWYRNSSSGYNYLYLLNGLTITSEGYTNTVGTTWSIAGIGDFNGDGKSDVMWRESGTGYNYLYPMDGFTVLGTAGYLPTVSDASWTVQGTGDTNKDGISDLLWRQNSTGYNFVWRMNGTSVISVCGSGIGCYGGVLPSIDEAGWSIVNK